MTGLCMHEQVYVVVVAAISHALDSHNSILLFPAFLTWMTGFSHITSSYYCMEEPSSYHSKILRMFGTLVASLPSKHEGGEFRSSAILQVHMLRGRSEARPTRPDL